MSADVNGRVERIGAEAGEDALPAEGSPEARRLRRWVLHTLINEAIIAREAARRRLVDDAEAALVPDSGLEESIVLGVFEAVTAQAAVDDAAVRRYYDTNIDLYRRGETRDVHAVVASDEGVAEGIARRATSGTALHAAVAAAGSNGAMVDGPAALTLARGQMIGAVEDAVFAAVPGSLVGPIRTELGWHVMAVDRIRPASTVPLTVVADDILADLLAAERGRVFDDWIGQRHRELVTVRPGYEHPGDPRAPDAIHRH